MSKVLREHNLLPWLSSIAGSVWSISTSPSRDNLVHALPTSSVPATRCHICRARPISFYWPPTKTWDCSNPTLNSSFTVTAPFNLLSPAGLTTPAENCTWRKRWSSSPIKLQALQIAKHFLEEKMNNWVSPSHFVTSASPMQIWDHLHFTYVPYCSYRW